MRGKWSHLCAHLNWTIRDIHGFLLLLACVMCKVSSSNVKLADRMFRKNWMVIYDDTIKHKTWQNTKTGNEKVERI